MTCELLILGAGPTGLGAAWQLEKCQHRDWLLLEASTHPGGLASSFVDNAGFTWDIGGHVQFSHYERFDTAMDEFLGADGWLHHERESWVWMRGRFIPYPFQYHLHHLPAPDIRQCLAGLEAITNQPQPPPGNFEQWILATFGTGIADIFLMPYNFKVWACPPAEMNAHWVGERVAITDLARVRHNLEHQRDEPGWGPNNTFRFPKRGGTGAIWQSCAAALPAERMHLGEAVISVNLPQHEVTTSTGRTLRYERMLSTLPLTELIKLSGQSQLQASAERGLRWSASNIFGIGLRGAPPEHLRGKCWMYFPEGDCPFYRVTVFSHYSPHNVPDITQHWSLMAEVSESACKPVNQQTILEEVLQGLLNTGLIASRGDVISCWQHRAPHGYPIPGLHRDESLAEILPVFDSHQVSSRGRFGLWKYEVSNQDHSFMQGVEWVEHVLHGHREITAFDPVLANSRKHPWPYPEWS